MNILSCLRSLRRQHFAFWAYRFHSQFSIRHNGLMKLEYQVLFFLSHFTAFSVVSATATLIFTVNLYTTGEINADRHVFFLPMMSTSRLNGTVYLRSRTYRNTKHNIEMVEVVVQLSHIISPLLLQQQHLYEFVAL